MRTLFRQDWVVYAKRPFGGPEHVLQYLARYTHRVAISNHRLLNVTDHDVTFRWKDYAHHSKPRAMTLTHEEFLRRFLQHVLPTGFPRIRYFGFLANRSRRLLLPLCRNLLEALPPVSDARYFCYFRSLLSALPGTDADRRTIDCVSTLNARTTDWWLLLIAHNAAALRFLDVPSGTPRSACVHPLATAIGERPQVSLSAPRLLRTVITRQPTTKLYPHPARKRVVRIIAAFKTHNS